MTTINLKRVGILMALCAVCVAGWLPATLEGVGEQVIAFPLPPDPAAIGTQVGAINTYVTSVTLSPPASIHRLGLDYSEIRGNIQGVGWGGSSTGGLLQCHYTYDLPYVLRVPPEWDGGLVIYRHQYDQVDGIVPWETAFGDRSFFRVIHEAEDRAFSDAAVHPGRRWAYFAVNTTGVAPGGAYNSLVVDAPGCTGGTPVSASRDTPIARDHALLAQYLLKLLLDRDVTVTLGVGFVQGAVTNFALNGGYRQPNDLTKAGDNHRTPYDLTSPRIFDGFIWIDGNPSANTADLSAISAPTIFIHGDAFGAQQVAINQINRMASFANINVSAMARLYSIRNVSLLDADWNLSLTREGIDWADATLPPGQPVDIRKFYLGIGERLRPVAGALLDALAAWGTHGVPPPPSLFNGEVKTGPDRVEFVRTGAPATSYPYVDDAVIDVYAQNNATTPNLALRTAWSTVRSRLGGTVGSIVLPETACRRGSFRFIGGTGPIGNNILFFDESSFLSQWGGASAWNTCRIDRAEALRGQGLYDPAFAIVDIDPDHHANNVDVTSGGRLAVVIYSTGAFDATTIDPGSVRVNGASQNGTAADPGDVHPQIVDANTDGRLDLRLEFSIDRLRFTFIDAVADVWGRTTLGMQFSGSDLVQPAIVTCDVDKDGDVDANDVLMVRSANRQTAPPADAALDANGDGRIDIADVRFCQVRLRAGL
jgi:hypothetical protein